MGSENPPHFERLVIIRWHEFDISLSAYLTTYVSLKGQMPSSHISQTPRSTVNIQTKHKHSTRFKVPHQDPTLYFSRIANPRRVSDSLTTPAVPTLLHTRSPEFKRVLPLKCRYLALRCSFICCIKITGSNRFTSATKRPDRFWGPPSLQINWHRGFWPRGKAAGALS